MSANWDIFEKLKNILSRLDPRKENKFAVKRKAEYDRQAEADYNFKYRRVSSAFPKFIEKPFEEDTPFVRQGIGQANYGHRQMARRKEQTPHFFKPPASSIDIHPYADLEFSDIDENELYDHRNYCPTPSTNPPYPSLHTNDPDRFRFLFAPIPPLRHNASNFRGAADRRPPPLIAARTGQLVAGTSKMPDLYRIRANNWASELLANTSKTRATRTPVNRLSNGYSMVLERNQKQPFRFPRFVDEPNRNALFSLPIEKSVASELFVEQERDEYKQLLAKLCPGLYDRRADKNKKSMHSDSYASTSTKRHSQDGVMSGLVEGAELQPKETIDLSYDDVEILETSEETKENISKLSKSHCRSPPVEPINTLKERIDLNPIVGSNWMENLKERYSSKSAQVQQELLEEQENNRKLHEESRQTRDLERRLQSFYFDVESIVVDEEIEIAQEVEFPELTPDILQVIHRAINGGSDKEVLISKFNINIKRADIKTLQPGTWLNDEIINFYMSLLMERGETSEPHILPKVYSMNTFFIPRLMSAGHSGVSRWTRKVDLFAYEIIPVPVHVGNIHWCMAIINLKKSHIKYYDSMGRPNERILNALLEYLRSEAKDKKNQILDTNCFKLESVVDCPRQMNGSDCGVFSCMFAEYATLNKEITFSQENMSYFRQKMIYEIVSGKLMR